MSTKLRVNVLVMADFPLPLITSAAPPLRLQRPANAHSSPTTVIETRADYKRPRPAAIHFRQSPTSRLGHPFLLSRHLPAHHVSTPENMSRSRGYQLIHFCCLDQIASIVSMSRHSTLEIVFHHQPWIRASQCTGAARHLGRALIRGLYHYPNRASHLYDGVCLWGYQLHITMKGVRYWGLTQRKVGQSRWKSVGWRIWSSLSLLISCYDSTTTRSA